MFEAGQRLGQASVVALNLPSVLEHRTTFPADFPSGDTSANHDAVDTLNFSDWTNGVTALK